MKCQHGFIKGSCVTQLLAVLDKWTKTLAWGKTMDDVYLDFAKPFDFPTPGNPDENGRIWHIR